MVGKEKMVSKSELKTNTHGKSALQDIKARNYNLDCKNPHVGEQEIHDPDLLLEQYSTMQKDIAALRSQLKDILSAALTSSPSTKPKAVKSVAASETPPKKIKVVQPQQTMMAKSKKS